MSELAEQLENSALVRVSVPTEAGLTYRDYLLLPDSERWEIIGGIAYDMTPAPTRRHQEISIELFKQLAAYLDGKPCKVYYAPFDVRFTAVGQKNEDARNVVQPDLLVVCDMSKLDERGCIGAPDLIVEIVSPSTASMDYIKKLELYEKFGVREYWIVHPTDNIVMVYLLNADGKYERPKIYASTDTVRVNVLEDCAIDLGAVFAE